MADSGDATYQRQDGVVCKLVSDEFAPVIPGNDTLCLVLLWKYYASALGGHMGEKKLLATVRWRFYWPGLAKDVKHFCHECLVCQANKHST